MFKFAASMLTAYAAASEAGQFGYYGTRQQQQNPYGQGSFGQPTGYGGAAQQLQNKLKSSYPPQQNAYQQQHAPQQHAAQQFANQQYATQQQAAYPQQHAPQQQGAFWQPGAHQPSAFSQYGQNKVPSWATAPSQTPSQYVAPTHAAHTHGAHTHTHAAHTPSDPNMAYGGVDPRAPAADPDCTYPNGFTCDQEFSPAQYKYESKAEQPAFAICIGETYYVQLMQLPGKPIYARGGPVASDAEPLTASEKVTTRFNKLGRIADLSPTPTDDSCSVQVTGPTFFPLQEFDKWGAPNQFQDPSRGTVGECVNGADGAACEFGSLNVEQNILGLYGVLGRSMTFLMSDPSDSATPAEAVDCCTIGYDVQGEGYPELETGYHPSKPHSHGHYDSHGGYTPPHDHGDLEGLITALTTRVEDLEDASTSTSPSGSTGPTVDYFWVNTEDLPLVDANNIDGATLDDLFCVQDGATVVIHALVSMALNGTPDEAEALTGLTIGKLNVNEDAFIPLVNASQKGDSGSQSMSVIWKETVDRDTKFVVVYTSLDESASGVIKANEAMLTYQIYEADAEYPLVLVNESCGAD